MRVNKMVIKDGISVTYPIFRQARRLKERLFRSNSGFLRVLIYHDISPEQQLLFARQIRLMQNHYRIIDPDTFCLMMEGCLPIEGGNLLLTFDDGFVSNYDVAEKMLDPLGIKALFFIIPGFVECEKRYDQKQFISRNLFDGSIKISDISENLRPMTWSQIRTLKANGHSIGGHSLTHARLSMITSKEVLKNEIVGCRRRLEQMTDAEIHFFAYPFGEIGSVNKATLEVANSCYKYVFSGLRGNNNKRVSPLTIRRDSVEVAYPEKYLQFILEGGVSSFYHFKRKQLDRMAQID